MEYFLKNIELFKDYYESNSPHEKPLPEEWDEKFNSLEKMIILKAIRPDKVIPAV